MTFKEQQQVIKDRFNDILEKPLLTSFLVLILLAILVLSLSYPYYQNDFTNFWGQVLAEAHGMLFDIAVIGILIFWLNRNGEKRLRIRMYKDEIDDFRLWESDEAAFRTVGNIKRLNRNKIFNINLVNCHLARTNLSYTVLKESNMNNANLSGANLLQCNLENARLNQANLENANMNQANMLGAYASGANFKDAVLIKTILERAFLIKADFTNAFLMEADLRGAFLTGAEMENANLYKADLRGAIGLTVEQLKSVKTLYQAKFDSELESQLKEEHPELVG
ncbi:MAG: pentapeptide repeat-containing protein [Bacteroidota bacterium]